MAAFLSERSITEIHIKSVLPDNVTGRKSYLSQYSWFFIFSITSILFLLSRFPENDSSIFSLKSFEIKLKIEISSLSGLLRIEEYSSSACLLNKTMFKSLLIRIRAAGILSTALL